MTPEENQERPADSIEMPAPTMWPLVAAFGVTLGFAGLVTNVYVTVVGAICAIAGAIGWWHDVLPQEKTERIRFLPPARRAAAVKPVPETVRHLVVGKDHRVRLPVEIYPYASGIKGGLVGAVAMAIVAILYGLIAEGSIWYPINLLAAAAMPSMAQADTAQLIAFSGTALVVALITHIVISIFIGLLYAVMLPMFPRQAPLWGGLLGPILWSGLIWASLGVINPALNDRIDWWWFAASQLAFGLTAGFVVAREERIETKQTWPLAMRAGVEATGLTEDREQDR